MSNKPVVTVIMPVYNAVRYVEAAINSILNQTYTNFELILVDDGATDGSEIICDEKAMQDKRIRVIHQKNKGICGARNAGLKAAEGKYISFCDHDDLYDENYLKRSVECAEKSKAEIVKFTYQVEIWNNDKKTKVFSKTLPKQNFSVKELCAEYNLFNMAIRGIWNGLYLRAPISKNKIYFDESIKAGMEDYVFNLQLLKVVQFVSMIPDVLFTHFARYQQSTSEKYSPSRYLDIIKTKRYEREFLKHIDPFPQVNWIRHHYQYLIVYLRTLMNPDNAMSWKEKKEQLKLINTKDVYLLSCPATTYFKALKKYPKEAIVSLMFHLRFYSILMYIYKRHRDRQL